MIDLPDRLRVTHECTAGFWAEQVHPDDRRVMLEAADEIERLRELLSKARVYVEGPHFMDDGTEIEEEFTAPHSGRLLTEINAALAGDAGEKNENPWAWEYGVIHFHAQESLRKRFYEVVDDCRTASVIVDIWLNDIGQVLGEYGYKMTITRSASSADAG